MGMEENHHAKNIFSNANKKEHNRKRPWVGPNPVDSFNKRKRLLEKSEGENPSIEFMPPKTPPLSRSVVSRCGEGLDWWHCYKDVVAYDTEQVTLLGDTGASGIANIRGGKVAVVDSNLENIYSADIYHKPGTFKTNLKQVAVSGIRKFDLIKGKAMHLVTKELKAVMDQKLVIVVGGSTDFLCVDLNTADLKIFDLQTFYKRTQEGTSNLQPMSLRDTYFMEFKEDFQGNKTHSAENDARATMRLFISGYVKRNFGKATMNDRNYFEIFDGALVLPVLDCTR